MTKKEALIKSLIWRFGVSIPVSFLLNLIFLKEINASVANLIIANNNNHFESVRLAA